MYPYTKELTLDEALKLHEKDRNARVFYNRKDWEIYCWNIQDVYSEGKSLFCTALDYATHILGQVAPPEGWGYAAYDKPEKYFGLSYMVLDVNGKWVLGAYINLDFKWSNWYQYAFRLSYLARVEEEPNPLHLQSLNELADTAFENKPVTETENTETDWKAKYEFVEVQKNNAVSSLALLQADFNRQAAEIQDLENYKSISDSYVKALEAKLNAIEALTSAQWNLAKARNDYYPF